MTVLILTLKGNALTILPNIPTDKQNDYMAVVVALETRFATDLAADIVVHFILGLEIMTQYRSVVEIKNRILNVWTIQNSKN